MSVDIDPKLDEIIPGVVDAYRQLRATNGMGIYTSNGEFYNHTFFGRDAAMSAKFVADFDHSAAVETIMALAALQGKSNNKTTQEQPGRIHHELRDFTTWHGNVPSRLSFFVLKRFWGAKSNRL